MSNNKQSSVELFAIALYEGGYLQGNGDEINELLEHHKAMHEYEIKEAFLIPYTGTAYEYYQQTYGGNK
jgi:hypothetical protein